MSRRASLPGAEELFRRTDRPELPERHSKTEPEEASSPNQVDKSSRLQVAKSLRGRATSGDAGPETRAPKHDEKVTFYCTGSDLMALESARLRLRGEHGTAADRGRIVRAALSYVLEDFDARGEDSILLDRLRAE